MNDFVMDNYIGITVDKFNELVNKDREQYIGYYGHAERLPNGAYLQNNLEVTIESHGGYINYIKRDYYKGNTICYRAWFDGEIHNDSHYTPYIARALYKVMGWNKDTLIEGWDPAMTDRVKAKMIGGFKKDYAGDYIPYCIQYDLNSAYAAKFLESGLMPDWESKAETNRVVGQNEFGIRFEYLPEEERLRAHKVEPGEKAQEVYKLRPIPQELKDLLLTWFDNKQKAKTKDAKAKWKAYLSQFYTILGKKFKPIQIYVAELVNKYIESLIDDNVIMWNVDSITCLEPRDDLELTNALGKWKIEAEGRFCMQGNKTYDFPDLDIHKAAGVCIATRAADYDCLHKNRKKDFPFYYNEKTGLIEKGE